MGRIHSLREKLLILALLAGYVLLSLLLGRSCPIFSLIGLPCPGCGMTRACLSFLHGDSSGAFANHAMFWSLPLLLLLFLFDGRLFSRRWANILLWAALIAGFAANWMRSLLLCV